MAVADDKEEKFIAALNVSSKCDSDDVVFCTAAELVSSPSWAVDGLLPEYRDEVVESDDAPASPPAPVPAPPTPPRLESTLVTVAAEPLLPLTSSTTASTRKWEYGSSGWCC